MHKLTKEFTKLTKFTIFTKFVNYKKILIDKYQIWKIMKNWSVKIGKNQSLSIQIIEKNE